MTVEELAEKVGADPKTVYRWTADEARVPHPRFRLAAADALKVDESMIWPEIVRASVKTGPDREIVSAYPTGAGRPLRKDLVIGARHELVFVTYTAYRLWQEIPDVSAILRQKVADGCRVRFIIGDPAAEIARLTDQVEKTPLTIALRIETAHRELRPLADVVETRQTALCWGKGGERADDQAIVGWPVLGQLGAVGSSLHLRRRMDGGWFDKWCQHCEALWEAATPVWP
jgi:transcriptional regulator with XRE-family HTH domain